MITQTAAVGSGGGRVSTASRRDVDWMVPIKSTRVSYDGGVEDLVAGRDRIRPTHEIVRALPHLFQSLTAWESRHGRTTRSTTRTTTRPSWHLT